MEILSENRSGRRLVHIRAVGAAVLWVPDTIQATPTKEYELPTHGEYSWN